MKKLILSMLAVACIVTASAQRTIYVAPDGNDTGAGTKEAPYASIQKALDEVEPGGTVYLRGGTYYPGKRLLPPRKATTAERRITFASYPGERAVIDGSKMSPKSVNEFKQSRCLYLTYWCNYYHVKDIDFTNALDNGVKLEGSYNIFENCRFYRNNDTGLQIGMFKDWAIEEHNGFYNDAGQRVTGTPEFNPGYQFCRGNIVINCDSYLNADVKAYNGSDDGGDADGFACKLFPGPGTEFYGCRAWINSDDNWDLYMVYHPVVIDHCWAYKGGYTESGSLIGNGNGFKLGGGGSSGGAAFSQSVGAHVVRNCVAFDNGHKGFDQNNAYEGMYIINCTAWGNDFNYRFPTVFQYGGMYIRNCVGFRPVTLNHEFLSEDKEGSVVPNTDFNSWTTLDGCYPYKDGKKNGGKTNIYAQDYTSSFLSLSVNDFMADREADGSLPENDFARLREGSVLIDKGTPIENFVPERFMTESQANGLELVTAEPFTIPYAGAAPDFGAYEFGAAKISRLTLKSGSLDQTVYIGTEIAPIVVAWSGDITDVEVGGITESCGLSVDKNADNTLTVSGNLNETVNISFHAVGVDDIEDLTGTLTASTLAPGTLECTSGNASQSIMEEDAITPITYVMGGGATEFVVTESVSCGLKYVIDGNTMVISGTPTETVTYTVVATGGMTEVSATGTITVAPQTHTLGAADESGWYQFQTGLNDLPEDLVGVVTLNYDNADSYGKQFSETGNTGKTFWDPTWSESGYSALLSDKGACNIGSGSALEWTLPSCSALKVNLYTTGKRSFKIHYLREGIDSDWVTVNVAEMSKGSYTLDLLDMAGIQPCRTPIVIRFEGSSKGSKMLGARVYDMYVECFGRSDASGISSVANDSKISVYSTATAIIAQGGDVASIDVYDMAGAVVARSSMSGICPTRHLHPGIYVAKVTTREGKTVSVKVMVR